MFEFDGTASYQFKKQTRCLTALEGDTDHNRFVLASLELREPNELHVLDFNEDTNEGVADARVKVSEVPVVDVINCATAWTG